MSRSVKYVVVIERAPANYAAYVPDLPGCVATGATVEEVTRNIREAIELHLAGLREDDLPIPEPHAEARVVEVAAPA
ncbi:MAG TPA: type II toxin-antitoxin system HicB family antitoxin [Thermomicrobiaceae bacterium]|nr:type II toxin-antitoxin system HicB family antitoxin [Thermomicrobiaceae bacterium]